MKIEMNKDIIYLVFTANAELGFENPEQAGRFRGIRKQKH